MSQDNQTLSNEAPKASHRAVLTAAPAAAAAAAGRRYRRQRRRVRTGEGGRGRSDLRGDRTAHDACRNHAAEDETSELADLEADALCDLLDCQPTSLAGIAALLEHLAQPQWGAVARDPEHRETVLSGAPNWGGDIKIAALKLPGILAETMRSLIEGGVPTPWTTVDEAGSPR
jgi:hypothetical protein